MTPVPKSFFTLSFTRLYPPFEGAANLARVASIARRCIVDTESSRAAASVAPSPSLFLALPLFLAGCTLARAPGAGTDGGITSTQCDANCSTRALDRRLAPSASGALLLAAAMLLLTSLFYYDITVPRAAERGRGGSARPALPPGVQSANSLTSAEPGHLARG